MELQIRSDRFQPVLSKLCEQAQSLPAARFLAVQVETDTIEPPPPEFVAECFRTDCLLASCAHELVVRVIEALRRISDSSSKVTFAVEPVGEDILVRKVLVGLVFDDRGRLQSDPLPLHGTLNDPIQD